MKVTEETGWYYTMNTLNVVIAAVLFLFVILLYNTMIIRRISRLSEEVQQISEGELDQEIHQGHNDEIGNLAASVDSMRDALIERMNNERQAWDANTQLITAMSHDIRTPLTSLIGYLDIIESGRFESEEERSRYIASSREKAFQLKELSDKLFRYFLVFGGGGVEREMENVDAGILFQQLLLEHVAETSSYGYRVNLQYNVPEGVLVRVDISSVQRLFDNLFSNIMKYADRRFSVEIKADLIKDKVKLILSNHIQEETKKVESTMIGVKTCKKICTDMGCTFHAMEEEKIYTTEILIPVLPTTQKEE
jgi:signal transduction histidine kinase